MGNKHSAKDKSVADGVKAADNTFDVYAFPFENVVFEGGSNNLLAFVGAVRCLEEAGIWSRVTRLAGSGTGALLATLLSLGYSSVQVENMLNFDLRALTQDRSCSGCCLGCAITSSFGWHPNNKVISWLGAQIKKATGSERTTFLQIYKNFNRELCVVVSNVSESCAEYCHHKTTPDLPIIDALRMTMATPGLCSPVKYQLNSSQQLFADGGLFHNYPIHCFDGWWLSGQNEDSFLSHHDSLHDQTRLTDDQTRFSKFNSKTIGFVTYGDFASNSFTWQLDQRSSQQKTNAVVVPNNSSAKNWDKRKQEAETDLETYITYTATANKFTKELNNVNNNVKKPLSKSDVTDMLKKIQSVTAADLKVLFEGKHTGDEIWSLLKPQRDAAQPCAIDIIKYLENTSFRLYRRSRERYASNDVTGLADYWHCLQYAIHRANGTGFVSKDVERTVGINVRYLGGLHAHQLTQQDRVFLIEQGRHATRLYLEQFIRTSSPPIKDSPVRSSYYRDDLAHYIDDEVSEIIDERDYMENSVTRHR